MITAIGKNKPTRTKQEGQNRKFKAGNNQLPTLIINSTVTKTSKVESVMNIVNSCRFFNAFSGFTISIYRPKCRVGVKIKIGQV